MSDQLNEGENKSLLKHLFYTYKGNSKKIGMWLSFLHAFLFFLLPAYRIHRTLRTTIIVPETIDVGDGKLEYDFSTYELLKNSYKRCRIRTEFLGMKEFGKMLDILTSWIVLVLFMGLNVIFEPYLRNIFNDFYDYLETAVCFWIMYCNGGLRIYREFICPYVSKHLDKIYERFNEKIKNYHGPMEKCVGFITRKHYSNNVPTTIEFGSVRNSNDSLKTVNEFKVDDDIQEQSLRNTKNTDKIKKEENKDNNKKSVSFAIKPQIEGDLEFLSNHNTLIKPSNQPGLPTPQKRTMSLKRNDFINFKKQMEEYKSDMGDIPE